MDGLWMKTVLDHAPVGIVVMDEQRVIHFMNERAQEMTNWRTGDTFPHCLYCQARELTGDGEQCILALDDPLPVFQTQLPNHDGDYEIYDVRTDKLTFPDGNTYMILALHRPQSTQGNDQLKVERLLVRETMRVQEVERKRIARELHDHIGQSVYSIFLGVQGMKNHLSDPKYMNHLRTMETHLEQTMDDIKLLSKELRPQVLDSLGLCKALQVAVTDWQTTYGVQFEVDCEIFNKELFKDAELQLFRVMQEAVRNAIRHGQARHITIRLQADETSLRYEIIDNGQGFDVHNLRNTGLGLFHMKERMKMVRGDVKWDSRIGGPTRIYGHIPFV
jgi:signal transduction histidine kinase